MDLLDNLYSRQNYVISNKLLDATHLKQEIYSNNLANIETPGFKRGKVSDDFERSLQSAAKAKDLGKIKNIKPKAVTDFDAKPVRLDGNNVELDKELMRINRNAMHYQFLTQMVSGSIKHLNTAIRGRA